MTLFENFRRAAQKRALYRRTVNELMHLDAAAAEDLGIFPGDVHRIAQRAVYGN